MTGNDDVKASNSLLLVNKKAHAFGTGLFVSGLPKATKLGAGERVRWSFLELDRRWHLSYVPAWLTILGYLLFIIGWIIIFFVFRVNSYAASTIEIASDQKVITTGPYAVIRHPMYAGAFLYCLGTPLGLGSYWGFLGLAFMT